MPLLKKMGLYIMSTIALVMLISFGEFLFFADNGSFEIARDSITIKNFQLGFFIGCMVFAMVFAEHKVDYGGESPTLLLKASIFFGSYFYIFACSVLGVGKLSSWYDFGFIEFEDFHKIFFSFSITISLTWLAVLALLVGSDESVVPRAKAL